MLGDVGFCCRHPIRICERDEKPPCSGQYEKPYDPGSGTNGKGESNNSQERGSELTPTRLNEGRGESREITLAEREEPPTDQANQSNADLLPEECVLHEPLDDESK